MKLSKFKLTSLMQHQKKNMRMTKNDSESSIPLVVSVFKENGVSLEFGVTAFPDEISIDSLSIKQSEESEDQLAYEGPEFM